MQTHINRKKYVNGSANLEGHLKKFFKPCATVIQAFIYPFMSSKAQYSETVLFKKFADIVC
jgi:hypothetical protein